MNQNQLSNSSNPWMIFPCPQAIASPPRVSLLGLFAAFLLLSIGLPFSASHVYAQDAVEPSALLDTDEKPIDTPEKVEAEP
ncbi:secreted protein [Rhodopirellula sallentina SM41]|uniref:Secreted protein n=2 Tax=Rhodopirellula TaxID=265488 RepID=M5U4X6_9BACT|nr:secreted protein [Rhodopirellula sallentina SM41]